MSILTSKDCKHAGNYRTNIKNPDLTNGDILS